MALEVGSSCQGATPLPQQRVTPAAHFSLPRWLIPQWSKDVQAAHSTGQVVTPMPGKVSKVAVAEGQSVRQGETLLVLEVRSKVGGLA